MYALWWRWPRRRRRWKGSPAAGGAAAAPLRSCCYLAGAVYAPLSLRSAWFRLQGCRVIIYPSNEQIGRQWSGGRCWYIIGRCSNILMLCSNSETFRSASRNGTSRWIDTHATQNIPWEDGTRYSKSEGEGQEKIHRIKCTINLRANYTWPGKEDDFQWVYVCVCVSGFEWGKTDYAKITVE